MSAAQPGKHPLVAMAEGWNAYFGKKKKKKPETATSDQTPIKGTALTRPTGETLGGKTVLGS